MVQKNHTNETENRTESPQETLVKELKDVFSTVYVDDEDKEMLFIDFEKYNIHVVSMNIENTNSISIYLFGNNNRILTESNSVDNFVETIEQHKLYIDNNIFKDDDIYRVRAGKQDILWCVEWMGSDSYWVYKQGKKNEGNVVSREGHYCDGTYFKYNDDCPHCKSVRKLENSNKYNGGEF
jgi:hypothetical protein